MSEYEKTMVTLEKIEVGRKMYADLYDRGCIDKQKYEGLMNKLALQLSKI